MNLTSTEHARLLRELAKHFVQLAATHPGVDDVYGNKVSDLYDRACQAAEEIEGREVGPDLDDLIDQAWRLHQTIGYQGERLMYEQGFDRAVRLVLARFGGGEGLA